MRKLFIVLALILLTTGIAQAAIWFEGSFDQAKAQAQQEKKLILVDFFSAG
jgi:hypothetical protein